MPSLTDALTKHVLNPGRPEAASRVLGMCSRAARAPEAASGCWGHAAGQQGHGRSNSFAPDGSREAVCVPGSETLCVHRDSPGDWNQQDTGVRAHTHVCARHVHPSKHAQCVHVRFNPGKSSCRGGRRGLPGLPSPYSGHLSVPSPGRRPFPELSHLLRPVSNKE